jgi:[acyl-carrier-protein] S-malonyltransferase
MRPAAEGLARELSAIAVSDPALAVVRNVDAEVSRTGAEVKRALVEQVASPVRWTDSVARLVRDGAVVFVEVGPGRVLTGLLRRIVDGARGVPVESPGDLERALATLGRA